ncbi:MAG: transporter [Bacteroidota bacterium]
MRIKKMIFGLALLVAFSPNKSHAQVLETEESKPLLPGQFEIGTGLEFQTSKEGTESALPVAIEYGLSKKFTLLVEPVGFTSIRPKVGLRAKGLGDLELTLFYQIVSEKKILPSISISAEVKIPTAKDRLIGTGKADYTPYLIMSKTTGKFFTSINLSYTFLGKPSHAVVNNLFSYAVGSIFKISEKSIIYAEVYGNTSAVGEGGSPEATITVNANNAELTGGETVAAFGYGFHAGKELLLSFGINYDNNNAILLRPGIEWKFGGKN